MPVNVLPDGEWVDFRNDRYRELLRSTSWVWLNLARAYLDPPKALRSSREVEAAYDRAVHTLPQLPMEWGSSRKRYDRSRWRHVGVSPGISPSLHCEHPWSKRVTRVIVMRAASEAIERGDTDDSILDTLSRIIDSRQDTVLLHTLRTRDLNILDDRVADGLFSRYESPVSNGLIVDRATGKVLTPKDAKVIDQSVLLVTEKYATKK